MSKVYPVTITNGGTTKTYTPEFQVEERFSKSWKSVLQRAHGAAELSCECSEIEGRRLAVRHYDENDSFGLARFPLTGTQHVRDCQFYSPTVQIKTSDGETISVIDSSADGTVKVRLGIGLRKQDDQTDVAPSPERSRQSGGRRQAPIKLLGLLQFLWTEAGLNRWWPAMEGKRDTNRVHWLIHGAAAQVKVGRIPLDSTLLLSAKHPDGKVAIANRERVAKAAAANTRLLVIAPLAKFSAERAGEAGRSLRIAGFHGTPFLRMTAELWTVSEKRYPRAMSAWRAGRNVMAIAQIELPANTTARADVVDVGFMHVTETWIPVDSSYEEIVANKLVEEHRAFEKPLRFDHEEDLDHPDFLLIDTVPDTAMEVFGRTDAKYLVRKAGKIERHSGNNNWWHWDAASDPEGKTMPPFPPKKNR
jgi:hypothetical protein